MPLYPPPHAPPPPALPYALHSSPLFLFLLTPSFTCVHYMFHASRPSVHSFFCYFHLSVTCTIIVTSNDIKSGRAETGFPSLGFTICICSSARHWRPE